MFYCSSFLLKVGITHTEKLDSYRKCLECIGKVNRGNHPGYMTMELDSLIKLMVTVVDAEELAQVHQTVVKLSRLDCSEVAKEDEVAYLRSGKWTGEALSSST